MRVAVTWPGDPVAHLVEAPDESDANWSWTKSQIGGDLDYTTLAYWTSTDVIIQMVSDDWFLAKELPVNEVASRLYRPDLAVQRPGFAGICGPAVVVAADRTGEAISLPDEIVDWWILAGICVDGT